MNKFISMNSKIFRPTRCKNPTAFLTSMKAKDVQNKIFYDEPYDFKNEFVRNENTDCHDLLNVMQKHNLRYIPICDDNDLIHYHLSKKDVEKATIT